MALSEAGQTLLPLSSTILSGTSRVVAAYPPSAGNRRVQRLYRSSTDCSKEAAMPITTNKDESNRKKSSAAVRMRTAPTKAERSQAARELSNSRTPEQKSAAGRKGGARRQRAH